MIVNRSYCSFCGRHADDCRVGLYTTGDCVQRICRYCLFVALREFGESDPGRAEVVMRRRAPPVKPWPEPAA